MRLLIIFSIISLTASVHAATTSFTDYAAFTGTLGAVTVYGFDSFVLDEGADIYGPHKTLGQQIPGVNFGNARVNLGAYGGTSRSPQNVVLNADFVNPIVISFTNPQRGIGLFNTSLVDAETFEVFDSGGALLGSVNLPDQVINFGGFVSDAGIAKAVITPLAPTNGSIYIDDLTLSAVPEPGSLFLVIAAGVVVLGRSYCRARIHEARP